MQALDGAHELQGKAYWSRWERRLSIRGAIGFIIFFSAFQFSLLETSFLGLKLWASYVNITRAVTDKY